MKNFSQKSVSIMVLVVAVTMSFANQFIDFFDFSDDASGTAVLPFLKNPATARDLALGGNIGAINEQASVVQTNPAGLGLIRNYWSTINHAELFGEFRQDYVATTIPFKNFGTFGLGLNSFRTTDFEDIADEAENSTSFSASDVQVGLAYGQEVIKNQLMAGAKANYLYSQLGDVQGQAFSMDFGLLGFIKYGLMASASVHQLSTGLQYRTSTAPTEKLPLELKLSLGKPLQNSKWAWVTGYQKSSDGSQNLNVGLEYRPLTFATIRSGYRWNLHDDELDKWTGISAGAGVQMNSLSFDYGFKWNSDLGSHHYFTLNLSNWILQNTLKLTWSEKLQESFKAGKCSEVERFGQKAMAENPGDLQSLALVQECRRQDKLKNGLGMTFLITANSLGSISAVRSGGAILGGLSRRSTLIEEIRSQVPQTILLDAGRVFGDEQSFREDSLMQLCYQKMDYDAVLSSSSLYRPIQILSQSPKWLGALNKKDSNATTEKNFEFKGKKIQVLGVSFLNRNSSEVLLEVKKEMEFVQKKWSQKPDLQVVLVDGTTAQAEMLIRAGLGFQVVLLSGREEYSAQPYVFQEVPIVSIGLRGSHLGRLNWYFYPNGSMSWDYQAIPVSSALVPDPKISKILDESLMGLEDQENVQPIFKPAQARFVFYKNQSANLRDLYIQDPIKKYDYRMNKEMVYWKNAKIGHSRNRLIAIKSISEKMPGELIIQSTDSKEYKVLSDSNALVGFAEWDAYENWIYYTQFDPEGRQRLMRVRPSGYEKHEVRPAQEVQNIQEISPSSNGRFLALTSLTPPYSKIYHIALSVGRTVPIGPDTLWTEKPQYSPDGLKLAFLVSNPSEPVDERKKDLWVYNFGQDSIYKVTQNAQVESFVWTEESDQIVWAGGKQYSDLNISVVENSKTHKLIPHVEKRDWIEKWPRSYRVANQEGILFERLGDDFRRILWTNLQGTDIRVISDLDGKSSLE